MTPPPKGAGDRSATTEPAERLRLDKWLWRARFYRSRALAAAAVEGGRVRVNGARTRKAGAGLKIGDQLTLARPSGAVLLRVVSFGARRGPPAEAATLYAIETPGPPGDAGAAPATDQL